MHENLQARHNPPTQAKFLEQPFREGAETIATIIRNATKGGRTVAQALLLAGLWLQNKSQRLTPVLTGALRASAFTRREEAP